MTMQLDLPLIFTVLMGLAILAYVILDGFDLGVGILVPLATRPEQDMMVASIGPFWGTQDFLHPLRHALELRAIHPPVR